MVITTNGMDFINNSLKPDTKTYLYEPYTYSSIKKDVRYLVTQFFVYFDLTKTTKKHYLI